MPIPVRVLIVEDAPEDAQLMLAILGKEDLLPDWMRVDTEADYKTALAMAPDLILANWSLRQFSGQLAMQLLRAEGLDIPFIIVCDSSDEETALDGLHHGAYDYVLKNGLMRLGSAARRALAERQLRAVQDCLDETPRESSEQYRPLARLAGMPEISARSNGRPGPLNGVASVQADTLPSHCEYEIQTRQGARRPIRWNNSLLRDDHGLVVGVNSIGEDISERKQAEDKARRPLEHLTALRDIDPAITASFDLRLNLATILSHVTSQLHVSAASVLLLDPSSQVLEFVASRGFRSKAIERTRLRAGEGHAGRAALERRLIHVAELAQPGNELIRPLLGDEGFVSYFGVPLLAKGEVLGVLEIFHTAPLNPDEEWLDFLSALAGQAAIAIDNARLFEALQRSKTELTAAYDATIEGWSRALDLRDRETEGHAQRVMEMTVKLARALGLSEDELMRVRWGALLHDIGKMGVPDSILLKPGPLTDEEWAVIRQHPTTAFKILSPIRYLGAAVDIPYYHHEWWDGTGYPLGLRGEQIPLAARIFALVDVWDALRSDRPYRSAWLQQAVIECLRSQAGTHFDPQIVPVFFQLLESEGMDIAEAGADSAKTKE